jgi:predicted RNA-binding protein YlqC (UPF0109 family)
MKELAEFLVAGLVDQPDQVQITEKEGQGPNSKIIEVQVAPEDVGKVIGREGRIASAIRTVLKAAAAKTGAWVNVEIGPKAA